MKTALTTLTFNAPDLIKNLGDSLKRHLPDNQSWKWIIRDNSTNQDTMALQDYFKDHRFLFLKMPNEGNFASQHTDIFSAGHIDDCDNILLLNNDMIALTDFLSQMQQKLRNKTVGAVGGRLWYPDRTLQHAGVCISPQGHPFNVSSNTASHFKLNPNIHAKNRYYIAVTGACLLIRKDDYIKLGGMDHRYPWCFDDVELCFKLWKQLGKRCVTDVNANLIHIENYSTIKNPTGLKPSYKTALEIIRKEHLDMLVPNIEPYRLEFNAYD